MSEVHLADQLAGWIRRQGGGDVVAEWTRRLVLERARGHSCLDLPERAGMDGAPSLEESRSAFASVASGGKATRKRTAPDRLKPCASLYPSFGSKV